MFRVSNQASCFSVEAPVAGAHCFSSSALRCATQCMPAPKSLERVNLAMPCLFPRFSFCWRNCHFAPAEVRPHLHRNEDVVPRLSRPPVATGHTSTASEAQTHFSIIFLSSTAKVRAGDMVDGSAAAASAAQKEAETHRSPKSDANADRNQCASDRRTRVNQVMQTNKGADAQCSKDNSESSNCDNSNGNAVSCESGENGAPEPRANGPDIDFGIGCDDDEDPYAELQSYLDKVKVSVWLGVSLPFPGWAAVTAIQIERQFPPFLHDLSFEWNRLCVPSTSRFVDENLCQLSRRRPVSAEVGIRLRRQPIESNANAFHVHRKTDAAEALQCGPRNEFLWRRKRHFVSEPTGCRRR